MPHGKQSLLDSPRMRLGEIIFGWCYMPYYLLLTPLLITLGLALAGREYDIYKVNLIYFYVNFLALAFGCRRFLTASLQQTDLIRLLQAVLIAYGVQVICSLVIDILTAFLPSYENPADNETRDIDSGARQRNGGLRRAARPAERGNPDARADFRPAGPAQSCGGLSQSPRWPSRPCTCWAISVRCPSGSWVWRCWTICPAALRWPSAMKSAAPSGAPSCCTCSVTD